jgi:hypothetical protein
MTGSRKILSDIELQEEIDNLSDISSADDNLLDPDFERMAVRASSDFDVAEEIISDDDLYHDDETIDNGSNIMENSLDCWFQ